MMFSSICVIVILIVNITTLTQAGKCDSGIHGAVPRSIYDDLRCKPVKSVLNPYCPIKYDCSNIYERPKETCHFQGKTYKIGELIPGEELLGMWVGDCTCTKNLEFECEPHLDGCAESWALGHPKPGCYLKYELNSYCAAGEVCPPFDGNKKCDVKGVTYREGDKFSHPDEKCMQCVCEKGLEGKFEPPFCQPVNCTAEIIHSKAINNHCAPYYDYKTDSCCPRTWVCPSESGVFKANPVGTPTDQPATEFSCQFGDHIMHIGDYYEHEDKVLGPIYCQCNIPPFVDCKRPPKPVVLNK